MDLADELYGDKSSDKRQGFDLAADLYGDEQKPTPVKLGREGFSDAMRQVMNDPSATAKTLDYTIPFTNTQVPVSKAVKWLQENVTPAMLKSMGPVGWVAQTAANKLPEGTFSRNVGSMQLGLENAWQGLRQAGTFGAVAPDPYVTKGASIAADEAPVGAVVADTIKYLPAFAGGGVLAPAAVTGAIDALTTPGDVKERASQGLTTAELGVGLGAGVKGLAWGAKKIGQLGSLSLARKALEDIIGPQNMPEALRLARSAPGNISAEQALEPIANPNIANLARITHGSSVESAAANAALLARQQAAREAAMQEIVGAGNQTAARDTARAMKEAVNSVTIPAMKTELAAANTAGTIGRDLRSTAERLGRAASGSVDDVRRISGAQQQAEELAQRGYGRLDVSAPGNPPSMGLPRLAGRYSYPAQLVDVAEGAAQKSADASVLLGEAGRFAQRRADSLAAYGLKPLDTNRMIGVLERKLQDPAIGPSDINTRVLSNVAEKIKDWTARNGGVIDAEALYTIRKSAVGDTVETLLGAADPKTKARRAAQLLAEVNPMIDDAITKAGGTGWKDYLQAHAAGMHAVEQQKMSAKAFELLKTSPKKFMELVKGDSPKAVEKVFGQGKYDIAKEMGPSDFGVMRNISTELERDANLLMRRASEGSHAAVVDAIKQHGLFQRIPNLLSRPAMIVNAVTSQLEGRANAAMLRRLDTAMRSPSALADLLVTAPVEERRAIIKGLYTLAESGTPAVTGATLADLVQQQ